ncbi:MAG: S8 family serine peptidase [Acidobacteria bacterium]|nr:S8 family serine peptidase [Acidobacteriota bacterium]
MIPLKSLFFLLVLLPISGIAQEGKAGRVTGEILIKFRAGTSVDASRSVVLKKGGITLERFGGLGWERVKLPKGKSVDQAIADYSGQGTVEAVQPNYYYHLLATPNDPSYGSLWGMAKISAPQAWDVSTGSSSVVVADIDTGIKYDHPDLAANVWTNAGEINGNGIDDDNNGFVDDFYGYDFFFNDSNPLDENGHGTHTAGTIGAAGNNGVGVAGVNWNVKIMAIKIYDNDGLGTTSAMLINAYNYVLMMKNRGVNIRVTNNSYGGCDEACGYDQATKDAIDALGRAGVLQVFAAGNDGLNIDTSPQYPAAYNSPWIISVANSTSSDVRNGSSNFGVVNVDLAAPGTSILSTINGGSGYGTLSGTSMATPHVAGAAALLAGYDPNLSTASLKATLLNTVDQLPAWNGVVKTGGRLNAAAALQNKTVCSFNVPSGTINLPTKGGYFTINVTAAANCDYQVKSNANWIRLTTSDSLSGNGTATFRATLNPTISRSGTIDIGGTTVTVIQSRS